MDPKEAFEQMNTLWAEMRPIVDRHNTELKSYSQGISETKEQLDRFNLRMDQLETRLNRPGLPGQGPGLNAHEQAAHERKDAYYLWCRKDWMGLQAPEIKLLSAGDDPRTGYLTAPPEIVREIIKNELEISQLRQYATVRTSRTGAIKIRRRTGTFAAVWAAEAQAQTETTGLKYGLEDLPMEELIAIVDVTNTDLEDSDYDLEGELRMEGTEQFALAEGVAFITGSGVRRPEGILTNASVASYNNGHATLVSGDSVVQLSYQVKTAYANQGAYLMNRVTIGVVRTLKDGVGNYLWLPGFAGGAPPTINSHPYAEMPAMPAIASAATPIAFGDWRRAYTIGDRLDMTVQRDPYSQSRSGLVEFTMRKRLGGQVVQPEAAVKLNMA